MTQEITADFHTLMDQGSMTGQWHLIKGVKYIDQQFGDGFAEKNPTFLGMFLITSTIDCGMGVLAQQVRAGLDNIADNLEGTDVEGIVDAIDQGCKSLADMVDSVDLTNSKLENKQRLQRLQRLAAKALLVAEHGDYSNGVTDVTGLDEGWAKASDALGELREEAKKLGVPLKGTFEEIDRA